MQKLSSGGTEILSFRAPPELSEAIRWAAEKSGMTTSDLLRQTLARAWGLAPVPQELNPQ